jgi:HK97 family phage prohead protease
MKNKFYQITNKSFEEYEVVSQKELWNKVKGEYNGFSCEIPVTFEKKTITGEDNKVEDIFTMIFSTPDKDRHGDIVLQNFELDFYRKNPVLLDSHNYDSITHIIGRVNSIRVEANQLKGELEFALMNPKGQLAKDMVAGGFINTSSIGFIPKEFDNEGKILKSELLENSLVSVPANAMALFEKKVKEITEEIEEVKKDIKGEKSVIEIKDTILTIEKKKSALSLLISSIKEMDKDNRDAKKRVMFKAIRSL